MSIMSEALYTVSFDPASMGRIAAMMNAQPTFARFYLAAMRECVNLVNMKAQQNAPVKFGKLRAGIRGRTLTPWLGKVGVITNIPYARRREFGFDARTDRLGRYYPRDPKDDSVSRDGAPARSHMFYLKRALEDSRPFIATRYRTATRMAIKEFTVGGSA